MKQVPSPAEGHVLAPGKMSIITVMLSARGVSPSVRSHLQLRKILREQNNTSLLMKSSVARMVAFPTGVN